RTAHPSEVVHRLITSLVAMRWPIATDSSMGMQAFQKHDEFVRTSLYKAPLISRAASIKTMSHRFGGAVLVGFVPSGCTAGRSSTATTSSPRATTTATSLASPQPLNFTVRSVAEGLVAPWALAFAADGTIWLTERPGRVRIIRNGQLLPAPALTLSVVTANGRESGLLGIAVKAPNVSLV